MTKDAPVKVAVWPPQAQGGTPSIWGKAQRNFQSSSADLKITYFLVKCHCLWSQQECHWTPQDLTLVNQWSKDYSSLNTPFISNYPLPLFS